MLKLLGSVLVCGSCTVFGISAWQHLRCRVAALEAIQKAIQYLQNEIAQNRTPLPRMIAKLAKSNNWRIAAIFRQLHEKIQQKSDLSFSYLWCRTFTDCREILGLQTEDIHLLCDAASFLGRYDAQQQLADLQTLQQELEHRRKEAMTEVKTRGKIYRSCGIAIGIVLVLTLL